MQPISIDFGSVPACLPIKLCNKASNARLPSGFPGLSGNWLQASFLGGRIRIPPKCEDCKTFSRSGWSGEADYDPVDRPQFCISRPSRNSKKNTSCFPVGNRLCRKHADNEISTHPAWYQRTSTPLDIPSVSRLAPQVAVDCSSVSCFFGSALSMA